MSLLENHDLFFQIYSLKAFNSENLNTDNNDACPLLIPFMFEKKMCLTANIIRDTNGLWYCAVIKAGLCHGINFKVAVKFL